MLRKLSFSIFIMVCALMNFVYPVMLSDNDGSAFMTHSEFDSNIANFRKKLFDYQQSFDDKMQDHINNYLSSVKIAYSPNVYYQKICSTLGTPPYFFNSINNSGSANLTTALNVMKEKGYSTQYKKSITSYKKTTFTINMDTSIGVWYLYGVNSTTPAWNNRVAGGTVKPFPDGHQFNKCILSVYGKNGTNIQYAQNSSISSPSWKTVSPGSSVTLSMSSSSNYILFNVSTILNGYDFDGNLTFRDGAECLTYIGWPQNGTLSAGSETQTKTTHNMVASNSARSGSGSAWEYGRLPNGNLTLQRYYSSYYPVQNVLLSYKTYKSYTTAKSTFIQNDLKDDNSCVFSPTQVVAYGLSKNGTRYIGYSTNNKIGYYEQILSVNKSSTDTLNYETAQFGNNSTQTIYACEYNQAPVKSSTNLASSYTNLAASTVPIEGVTHTTTAVTNNVYEIQVKPTQYTLNTFENSYYSGIAGETVKLGYGIPIMLTNADNSARYTITLGVKQTVAPAGTTVVSGNVTARLSMNHFVNGGFATSADRLYEGTISCNSSGVGTVTFTVDNIGKGQQLWLNLYGNTASRKVELTSFNVTMS